MCIRDRAYTFPTQVINALKLTNLRVDATGSNLFCLTNYNGYDPETGDWYPPDVYKRQALSLFMII